MSIWLGSVRRTNKKKNWLLHCATANFIWFPAIFYGNFHTDAAFCLRKLPIPGDYQTDGWAPVSPLSAGNSHRYAWYWFCC